MTFDQLNNILIENCQKLEMPKPIIISFAAVFGILIFNFLPFLISVLYGIFRLLFGTLYPAYASYKIVKSKDARNYVKWMMYWIVFAIFSSVETFTDIFVSWFPFYYEFKVLIVFWLLSPATNGSSFLYRKFVHPVLSHHENEIDQHISTIKERGYDTILRFGSRLLHLATNLIVQTAVKNLPKIALDPELLRNAAVPAQTQSETDSGAHANPIRNAEDEQSEVQSYDSDVSDDYSSDRRSVDNLLIDEEDCSSRTRKKTRTRSQPHRRTKKRTVN